MVSRAGHTYIVGVQNAQNVAELLCVASAMVEPCEVLRFLQNGHISLHHMRQCLHHTIP